MANRELRSSSFLVKDSPVFLVALVNMWGLLVPFYSLTI